LIMSTQGDDPFHQRFFQSDSFFLK
jgi:hypothetical protein